ncbi:hypothetical protein EV368DRAFT_89794 [Lentinula lateritia]|nr:hypothetical protein EV368DRAFT_89794 [Lentinula lateritia]
MELNPLDVQELQGFQQRPPLLPGPVVPRSPPLAHGPSPLPPASIVKKQKRHVKLDLGSKVELDSAPKHQCPIQHVAKSSHVERSALEVEETPDYHCVVLILYPPPIPVSELPSLSELGCPAPEFMPPNGVEDLSKSRIKIPPMQQHSQEPLRPCPRLQATSSIKAENDCLKANVEELRMLLTQACGQNSTLTFLLYDTSSSQDVLTHFYIAQSKVGLSKEVAMKQKQEIVELCKQVADAEQCSFDIYEELDSANTHAMHLEELEDMVCHYRDRAYVAEG